MIFRLELIRRAQAAQLGLTRSQHGACLLVALRDYDVRRAADAPLG